MNYYPTVIQQHQGFNVVRGDLYPGGLKCRVLTQLFHEVIREKEVAYAGCYFGHSGFALGTAGFLTGKKIKLFLPSPEKDTYIHRQVVSLNNVSCVTVDTAEHQDGTFGEASKYASQNGAYLLPIGFDYDAFNSRYVDVIQSLCESPEEVWVSGGSGVTAKCLQIAWPNTRVNVVNLNVRPNAHFGSPHQVWNIPEKLSEEVWNPPPWPSAVFYDAKEWQIVREHAKPGALIWNIA
ncbi:MAG: hypothetical protein JWP09_569 [Candidatus Taylorbacteria bacterium]|nr:hypothetical protein [Candidatus Taylorbacteria bacterium]